MIACRRFYLLIKPSPSPCKPRCDYCFYHDVAENRALRPSGFMSEEVLEANTRRVLEEGDSECRFAFQGGEPTLIGLDFYKRAVELEARYKKSSAGKQPYTDQRHYD